MVDEEKSGNLKTLKRTKKQVKCCKKHPIEKLDDVLVNLHIKICGLSHKEVISKIKRRLLGTVNLNNLPILIAEINSEWEGRRKISFSKTHLQKDSLLSKVLHDRIGVRNAAKITNEDKAEKNELTYLSPLSFTIKGTMGNNSFHTFLFKDLKVKGTKKYCLKKKTNPPKEIVTVMDFRSFFAEEILLAHLLRFSKQQKEDDWNEILGNFIRSNLSYRYKITAGNIKFRTNFMNTDTWFTIPESTFIHKTKSSKSKSHHAFFVGIGITKAQMGFFALSREAEKLGFGWFTSKYNKLMTTIGETEWQVIISDEDASRFEEEHREIARDFWKIIKTLGLDLYIFDFKRHAGNSYKNHDSNIDPKALRLSTTKMNAMVNIFTHGTEMMFKAICLTQNFSLLEALTPNAQKGLPIFVEAKSPILSEYLKNFVLYNVAAIQYKWEEGEIEKKGERARSYQDTKEFLLAKKSYLKKTQYPPNQKLTQIEELAKLAEVTPLGHFFSDIELDFDTDPQLFRKFEKEAHDFIVKIGIEPTGNRFKVRKLGNHRSLGIYYPLKKTLVVDVNFPDSFCHEYGHLIDTQLGELSKKPDFRHIVIFAVSIMQKNLKNLSLKIPNRDQLLGNTKYNFEYYANPSEIFARSFEIYCAFTLEMDLAIIQSKKSYTESFEYLPTEKKYIDIVSKYFNTIVYLTE